MDVTSTQLNLPKKSSLLALHLLIKYETAKSKVTGPSTANACALDNQEFICELFIMLMRGSMTQQILVMNAHTLAERPHRAFEVFELSLFCFKKIRFVFISNSSVVNKYLLFCCKKL